MKRLPLLFSASIAALGLAPAANAETNLYVGLGVEQGNTTVDPISLDGDMTNIYVTGGVRFSPSGNFFIGAEGETTLSTDHEFDGGGGDIDRISRLRALGGYDFGAFSAYVAAGGTWADTKDALGEDIDGWNYGVGGEYEFNDRFSARVEYIHDEGEFSNGNYEWQNDALRAGAIVRF